MITINCKTCNKEKSIESRQLRTEGNFCSKKCMGVSLSKSVERVCEFCNKSFSEKLHRIKEGKGKFCSKDCFYSSSREKISGKKFGKLTALKITDQKNKNNHGQFLWECLCDCGKKTYLTSDCLLSGKTKSCGCFKLLPFGEARINHLFAVYRDGAKKRKLSFDITRDDFKNMVLKNCHYCDSAPSQRTSGKQIFHGNIPLNGIDRINNDLGYVNGNTVPCCKKCNSMKMDYSLSDFLSHIEKISAFQENKGNEFPPSYLTVVA